MGAMMQGMQDMPNIGGMPMGPGMHRRTRQESPRPERRRSATARGIPTASPLTDWLAFKPGSGRGVGWFGWGPH